MQHDSLLGFALLGLLSQQPMSGYGLRTFFATSALGAFSDSPGAIYPALRRLEARGWVRGAVRASSGLRKQNVYRPTPAGRKALEAWLEEPVTRQDVMREPAQLMLRFAFTDQILGTGGAARFLRQFARELSEYIPELKQYLDLHGHQMPLSGRLALECGIQEYEARLRWAGAAAAIYESRRKST